jgi:hypothetical protein
MEITVIVVMWVVALAALSVVSNDRYGKDYKQREQYWRKFQ